LSNAKLTPTSYIVLGLVAQAGEATPYLLKKAVEASIGNFWSVPHSQVYAEPTRLVRKGLLSERRERGGRRRRLYRITESGRNALAEWADEPTEELPELRDLSLLKMFFGGDLRALAPVQRDAHRRKLDTYRELMKADPGSGPRSVWQTLEAGIRFEREWVRFWSSFVD
jgi:DNA-binding PadR family transcriptional regulator